MGNNAFIVWWIISFLILLLIAMAVGLCSKNGILGILIDHRGRYSLTHFQVVLWTIVILSSCSGLLIAHGFNLDAINISSELLGLMGISAGSAVLATGVKGSKDASTANIARVGNFELSNGTTTTINACLAQIWLEEEGDLADKVVSITKYQNFIFTLVIFGFYIAAAVKSGRLPELPERIVWLIGISHSGYVGGKVPNKK